ncbi:golgin subfamily A member 2-like [Gordionus sp. m RMFG-2023]|uniref:golgin subfamily A member 2-like n=1 Tax=Gordionus sp. m RMFG-2023 TaxID=3053472 RepID=UPI0031FBD18F
MNLTERETKIAAAKLKLEEYKLRKDGHILKENNGYMNRNPPIFMGTAEIITSSNVEHNDGYTYNYISNLNNKILVNHPLEERRGSFNKQNSIVNSLSSEDISNFSNDQIYIHPNFASKYYEDNQKYYNDLNSTMHNSIPQNTFAENQNHFYSQENKIINNRDKDVIIEIKDSSKMTNTLQMTPVLNENNKILPNKDQEFIHRLKNYKENLEAALNLTHKFVASLLGSPADSTEVVERTHAAYASELRDTLKDLNLYLPDAAEKVLEASPTEFQIKFDLTLKEIEQKNLLIEELERIERERIKQTKNLTQNNASLSLLLDQKKSESEFYQKKCAELENSLRNFQQRIQELKADAQDGKNLLKQTESDKIATSRALAQNKALKARLEELENNYVVKIFSETGKCSIFRETQDTS